ncbi:unnamed protein product, partial [Cyprideis torosa]
ANEEGAEGGEEAGSEEAVAVEEGALVEGEGPKEQKRPSGKEIQAHLPEEDRFPVFRCSAFQCVYVSLSLNRESLSIHRYISHFGGPTGCLRSTICYNMLRLANIQPGEVVCDPMCGGCSIPIER